MKEYILMIPLDMLCLSTDLLNVHETKAYHHWCLVTVFVEEDQINTLISSSQAFIQQQYYDNFTIAMYHVVETKSRLP